MDSRKRILLVSRDRMVLQTRKLMLGAYFDVSAACRISEAEIFLTEHKFDLIVFCYTLNDYDCQAILHAAREHSQDAKILMLTVPGYRASDLPMDSCLLPAEEGPVILVKKSAELLGFEFRSKGRMVRTMSPEPDARASRAA